MTIIDGSFVATGSEVILESMLDDARERFGPDLNDDEVAIIRTFYEPIANRLAEAQEDIGLVLSSAQIDNAEGAALDLLTALIGVRRERAIPATGEARFSRSSGASVDYIIPAGTVIQTNSTSPLRFQTDSSATLAAGETSVDVGITAQEPGVESNIGSNALTVMPNPPTGIESVTNPAQTTGGSEAENDEELRARAKEGLSDGASSTAPALVAGLKSVEGVRTVSVFVNDTNATDGDGLPPHSFEAVVDGGNAADVGQFLFEKKAAGTTSHSGSFGTTETATATLPNGQQYDVDFSRPIIRELYIDADLQVTDEYEGDDAVVDAVVGHTGGTLSTGRITGGELGVGDDVLIARLRAEVMSVRGVLDINSFTIGFDSTAALGGSNLPVDINEVSRASALDSSMVVNTTEV